MRARSLTCEIQRCCFAGTTVSTRSKCQSSVSCAVRVLGGAICFRGLGVPHRKFHQPLHRVAQWLSHVHDEPHQGRMIFKKMVPCRSKSQTQPPGADDLPPFYSADAQQTNYRLNFVWVCSVVKSGQLPQLTPDGSLSTGSQTDVTPPKDAYCKKREFQQKPPRVFLQSTSL